MEYVKNNHGVNKSALVRFSEEQDFDLLEKKSLEEDLKIYLIPENTEVLCDDNGWIISAKGDVKNIWQFIKGWSMPYECSVNGFPFPVKMEEMWKSRKEVAEVSVEELRWNLKFLWWSTDEEIPYNLTPEDVLKDVNLYLDHRERIDNSDTKYPLLLVQTKQGRWLIYDGVHRFVRQILESKDIVLCQKFLINEMERYIPESHKQLFREWCNVEYQ